MKTAPCFFVQNNYVERITVPVAKFARDNGYVLVDRSSTAEFNAADCGVDWGEYCPIFPYGSVQFIRKLKAIPALRKFVLHEELQFSATQWRESLGFTMLNSEGCLVRVEDVLDMLDTGPLHVRPNFEDKAFNATVFDIETWAVMLAGRRPSAGLECWASPSQPLGREWRCWIIGGVFVESSQYRDNGKSAVSRGTPDAVTAFASKVAQAWSPAPSVVMDIAETPSGFKVIEFNPIHCSGWYAADVPRVLRAWLDWAVAHYAAERAVAL